MLSELLSRCTAVAGYRLRIPGRRQVPGLSCCLTEVRERRVFVNYELGGAAKVIEPVDDRFETQIGGLLRKPRQAKRRRVSVLAPKQ